MASGGARIRTGKRSFPVTVTKLPVVRCQLCQATLAHRPGEAGETLTRHYEQHHPEVRAD